MFMRKLASSERSLYAASTLASLVAGPLDPFAMYSACQILGTLSKKYGLGKEPGPGLERAVPAGLALAYAKYCCPVGCRVYLTSSSRDTGQQEAAEGHQIRVFLAYHIRSQWKGKV